MTAAERKVFDCAKEIADVVGGLPRKVKAVRVSRTMRPDFSPGADALGLRDPETCSIVVRRD
jgi:hypothetical protein